MAFFDVRDANELFCTFNWEDMEPVLLSLYSPISENDKLLHETPTHVLMLDDALQYTTCSVAREMIPKWIVRLQKLGTTPLTSIKPVIKRKRVSGEPSKHIAPNAKVPSGYWNDINNLRNEAAKYTTRSEFQNNARGAYNAACKCVPSCVTSR
jgi:hypothetical protein